VEHYFSRMSPANCLGDVPFESRVKFAVPNEAYFAHVDWLMPKALRLAC
jgi:hypothetical protein